MSLRSEFAAAKVEYEEHAKKTQELGRIQGILYDTVEMLKIAIVTEEGVLYGTEWRIESIETERPKFISCWSGKCFEELCRILSPGHHSYSFDFDDFRLRFSDGDIYITDMKIPLSDLIAKYRLKVDWSEYSEIDNTIEKLESRIASLKRARELAKEVMDG